MTQLTHFLIAFLIQGGLNVLAVQDSFLFTQCECPTFSFFATEDRGGFISDMSTNGQGIDCPSGASRGIIRNFGDVNPGLDFTLDKQFFLDSEGERDFWSILLDLDISDTVEGESYTIASIDFPALPLDFIIKRNLGNLEFFIVSNGEVKDSRPFFGLGNSRLIIHIAEIFESNSLLLLAPVTPDFNSVFGISVANANGNVIGEKEDFGDTVAVSLFPDTNKAGSITLFSVGTESNFDTGGKGVLDISIGSLALFQAFDDMNAPALPVLDGLAQLRTDEDVPLTPIDLKSFLTAFDFVLEFELDVTRLLGLFFAVNVNGVIDRFEPLKDFFGEDNFTFAYGPAAGELPYECTLFGDVTITIDPVEDVPEVVLVDIQDSIAFVNIQFGIEVATSADFPDDDFILQEGFVIIETLPKGQLKDFDCVTPLVEGSSVAIVDGLFNFCFEGVELEGGLDEFTYFVRPGSNLEANQAVDAGLIELAGGNPIIPNPNVATRALFVDEDSGITTILIDGANFAFQDPTLDPDLFDFFVRILEQPDPLVGTLLDAEGFELDINFTFTSEETIFFEPALEFFNANADGGATNEDGEVIFDQSCAEDEQINGVCPDVFPFTVIIVDDINFVESEPVNFGIIVRAVNDENPILERSPEAALEIQFDDDESVEFLPVSSNDFEVSSDNGENVFQMGVRFVGKGGALIQASASGADSPILRGFNTVADADSNTNSISCDTGCPVLEVVATPNRLNGFLEDVVFNVPNEPITSANVAVSLSGDGVSFGEDVAEVEFVVLTESPTQSPTFSPTLNPTVSPTVEDDNLIDTLGAGGVAGVAFGVLLLCALCIILVLFLGKSDDDDEEGEDKTAVVSTEAIETEAIEDEI